MNTQIQINDRIKYNYDEESQLPIYVKCWNKNKINISKYVLGTGLLIDFILIGYVTVIEPISNVLTA